MPIVTENLAFSYDDGVNAVDNVSISFDDGKIYAIAGPTGCGKSTLVQLIAGLIQPGAGVVTIDDEDINGKKYDKSKLRQTLGIVFQYPESQLFEQTVEKDIAFGLKHMGLSKTEMSRRVKWAMDLMHLDYDKIGAKSPLSLSGGEKRKVAIAGVLAVKPKYLILDEPIAGLDPLARKDFMQMLCSLRDSGTTVIMVSHNADIICEYADMVFVMDKGRVAYSGAPNEVYSMDNLPVGTSTARQVCKMLEAKGVYLPNNIVTEEELLSQLLIRYKK